MLIGVYLVFKVTTSYEKIHQDNARSIERYVILWDVVKLYKILEIIVISTQRDNFTRMGLQKLPKTKCFREFFYKIPNLRNIEKNPWRKNADLIYNKHTKTKRLFI